MQMGNLAGQAALQQQIMAMSAMMGQGPFPAMSDGAQASALCYQVQGQW